MSEPVIASPAAPPRRRRGLWIALIASLTVNVFVVGWVASSWVYGPRFGPMRWSPPSAAMAFHHRRALHALRGSERQTADRIWRENFPEMRERVRALRQAHIDLRTAYVAEQADAKALGDAGAAFKARVDGVFDHVNATLTKIAAALPAEARKAYFGAGFPRRDRDRERRRLERRNQ